MTVKVKKKTERHKEPGTGKTGMDLALAVEHLIDEQYPEMPENDKMKLAMLLAKAGIKGQI